MLRRPSPAVLEISGCGAESAAECRSLVANAGTTVGTGQLVISFADAEIPLPDLPPPDGMGAALLMVTEPAALATDPSHRHARPPQDFSGRIAAPPQKGQATATDPESRCAPLALPSLDGHSAS